VKVIFFICIIVNNAARSGSLLRFKLFKVRVRFKLFVNVIFMLHIFRSFSAFFYYCNLHIAVSCEGQLCIYLVIRFLCDLFI